MSTQNLSPKFTPRSSSGSVLRTPRSPRRSISARQAVDALQLGLTQANDIQHLFQQYIQQIDKESITVRLDIDKHLDHIVKELMLRKEALHQQVNLWQTQKLLEVQHELDDVIKYEEALLKAQRTSNEILNNDKMEYTQKKQDIKRLKLAISSDTKFKKYKDSAKVTEYINNITKVIHIEYSDNIDLKSICEYGNIVSNTSKSSLSVPTLHLLKPIKVRESKCGYKLKLKWTVSHPLIADNFMIRCLTLDESDIQRKDKDDDEKKQETDHIWKSLQFEIKETNKERTTLEAINIDSVFLFDKVYVFRVEYHITDPVNLLIESNGQYFQISNLPPQSSKAHFIELEYFGSKGFSYEGHPKYLLSDNKAKMYRSKPNKEFDYGENDWIVFKLKHSGFVRQYLPKAITVRNSSGTQALKHLVVSIGSKGDGNEWYKYKMIELEDDADKYQQILLDGVDWKLVKEMKTQYMRLDLLKNYGESRGAQCRFKVHGFQVYGLEFK